MPAPTTTSTQAARRGTFADAHRGSRHERGYGSAWDKMRLRILARDAGLCQPCQAGGRVTVGNIVDHITPKAIGGTDDAGNLQCICRECHADKTAREALQARGIVDVRPRAHCAADGTPTDPRHPWNAAGVGGVQMSAPLPPRTVPLTSLAKPRNG